MVLPEQYPAPCLLTTAIVISETLDTQCPMKTPEGNIPALQPKFWQNIPNEKSYAYLQFYLFVSIPYLLLTSFQPCGQNSKYLCLQPRAVHKSNL